MSYIQAFEPLPWQVAPWRDTSPILLLTGSSGGGKSRLACEKIHGYMLRYPGATGLIMRKTRESLSSSTLLFLEREVIGNDPRVVHRRKDFRFEYENGSVLLYGGMKDEGQRERIRSIGLKGGLDIAWLEEATQFDEEDLNEVLARMRGSAAPWSQVILTTNPDAPGHWINIRLILGGEASVYKSKALDNRYNPASYQETLKKLSGVQYRRLVKGEWAAGSGAILDTWEDEYNKQTGDDFGGNVTEDADYIPEYGSVVWSIDDGYSGKMDKKTGVFTGKSHPRAILAAQMRPDGTLAVFAESLKIQTLATDHITEFMAEHVINDWPLPDAAVRDRAAASLDGALAKFHIKPRYNAVDVEESIKLLREHIAPDDNKVRRIIVHPRCFHLRYEALTFSYDNDGRIIKEYDHTIDSLRYLLFDKLYGKSHTIDIATYSDVVRNYGRQQYPTTD